jgi:hypothetical protein
MAITLGVFMIFYFILCGGIRMFDRVAEGEATEKLLSRRSSFEENQVHDLNKLEESMIPTL